MTNSDILSKVPRGGFLKHLDVYPLDSSLIALSLDRKIALVGLLLLTVGSNLPESRKDLKVAFDEVQAVSGTQKFDLITFNFSAVGDVLLNLSDLYSNSLSNRGVLLAYNVVSDDADSIAKKLTGSKILDSGAEFFLVRKVVVR